MLVSCNAGAGQTPQAAIGVLRLHPDTLQRGLTDQALGLLLPPTLQISFQTPNPLGIPDQGGPAQPSSSQDSAVQPYNGGELGRYQQQAQQSSSSSQQLSQQQAGNDSGQSSSGSSPEWRRLSGGAEGSGFGGNRGSIWAMVTSIGSLVPINMQVSCYSTLPGSSIHGCVPDLDGTICGTLPAGDLGRCCNVMIAEWMTLAT